MSSNSGTKIPLPRAVVKCTDAEAVAVEKGWGFIVRVHDPANQYSEQKAIEIASQLAMMGVKVGIFKLFAEVTKDGKK